MLKPLADRVLVEVDVEESKTAGGILLPDTAQKKSQKGTVIAIGEGGKKFLLLSERDILGKL